MNDLAIGNSPSHQELKHRAQRGLSFRCHKIVAGYSYGEETWTSTSPHSKF